VAVATQGLLDFFGYAQSLSAVTIRCHCPGMKGTVSLRLAYSTQNGILLLLCSCFVVTPVDTFFYFFFFWQGSAVMRPSQSWPFPLRQLWTHGGSTDEGRTWSLFSDILVFWHIPGHSLPLNESLLLYNTGMEVIPETISCVTVTLCHRDVVSQ